MTARPEGAAAATVDTIAPTARTAAASSDRATRRCQHRILDEIICALRAERKSQLERLSDYGIGGRSPSTANAQKADIYRPRRSGRSDHERNRAGPFSRWLGVGPVAVLCPEARALAERPDRRTV